MLWWCHGTPREVLATPRWCHNGSWTLEFSWCGWGGWRSPWSPLVLIMMSLYLYHLKECMMGHFCVRDDLGTLFGVMELLYDDDDLVWSLTCYGTLVYDPCPLKGDDVVIVDLMKTWNLWWWPWCPWYGLGAHYLHLMWWDGHIGWLGTHTHIMLIVIHVMVQTLGHDDTLKMLAPTYIVVWWHLDDDMACGDLDDWRSVG